MTDTMEPKTAREPSALDKARVNLRNEVSELDFALSNLFDKLSPVLVPDYPAPPQDGNAVSGDVPERSLAVAEIDAEALRLRGLIEVIRRVHTRLEV